MNFLLTIVGLIGVTREDNTPAQQSIASAILGVGLFRAINAEFPQKAQS